MHNEVGIGSRENNQGRKQNYNSSAQNKQGDEAVDTLSFCLWGFMFSSFGPLCGLFAAQRTLLYNSTLFCGSVERPSF